MFEDLFQIAQLYDSHRRRRRRRRRVKTLHRQ
jgi:hypothetical protein